MPTRTRRWIESSGFVGVWILLGYAFRTDANAYLVLGIPLTLGFQVFVRGQRVEDLWVRGGAPFMPRWVVRAVCLGATTCVALVVGLRGYVAVSMWAGAAVVGTFGVVYAFRHATRQTLREGVWCLVSTGAMATVLLGRATGWFDLSDVDPGRRLTIGIASLPAYIAVTFVLEEVSFRGAIDAHAHHPDDSLPIVSAAAVSVLWAVWHLPLARGPLLPTIGDLLLVHVPVGTALSVFWRRSGNLAVPAFSHAFIDALRNALLA
jgi:membrane protease YdiL (CAAX protease family)